MISFPTVPKLLQFTWCLQSEIDVSAVQYVTIAIGGDVAMKTECLWLIFRVCRTQILPLLDPKE